MHIPIPCKGAGQRPEELRQLGAYDTLGLAFSLDVVAWTKIVKGQAEPGARLLGGASEL